MIASKTTVCTIDSSVGINISAIEFEPGKSEKTMIEDFSSKPLEELQDCFGIYKEMLPKNRILRESPVLTANFGNDNKDIWFEWIHE